MWRCFRWRSREPAGGFTNQERAFSFICLFLIVCTMKASSQVQSGSHITDGCTRNRRTWVGNQKRKEDKKKGCEAGEKNALTWLCSSDAPLYRGRSEGFLFSSSFVYACMRCQLCKYKSSRFCGGTIGQLSEDLVMAVFEGVVSGLNVHTVTTSAGFSEPAGLKNELWRKPCLNVHLLELKWFKLWDRRQKS